MQGSAVYVDDALVHLHLFAREPDHPFDEVLVARGRHPEPFREPMEERRERIAMRNVRRMGIGEHDDVPAPRRVQVIHDLVDQDPVTDVQGGDHGLGRDVERLNQEGLDEERQDECDEQQERQFADEGKATLSVLRSGWLTPRGRSASRCIGGRGLGDAGLDRAGSTGRFPLPIFGNSSARPRGFDHGRGQRSLRMAVFGGRILPETWRGSGCHRLALLRLRFLLGLRRRPRDQRFAPLADAGSLPSAFPEVVQLGASNPTLGHHLDLGDGR